MAKQDWIAADRVVFDHVSLVLTLLVKGITFGTTSFSSGVPKVTESIQRWRSTALGKEDSQVWKHPMMSAEHDPAVHQNPTWRSGRILIVYENAHSQECLLKTSTIVSQDKVKFSWECYHRFRFLISAYRYFWCDRAKLKLIEIPYFKNCHRRQEVVRY